MKTLEINIDSAPIRVPAKQKMLWWQEKGLSYTASGYGRRIPTSWMIQIPGSPTWRRVYCCIYSNRGTCYVDGPKDESGKKTWIIVSD